MAPLRSPPYKVIAAIGGKGGPGKSTIVIGLATEWHTRGLRVLIVDLDPASKSIGRVWYPIAVEAGHDVPRVVSTGLGIKRELRAIVAGMGGADVVFLDTHGELDTLPSHAAEIADLVLIPSEPGVFNAHVAPEAVELARDMRASNGTGRPQIALVVSRRVVGTVLGREARDALKDIGEPVLKSEIYARQGHVDAQAAGLGPCQYARTGKAASDIRRLARELERLLGLKVKGTNDGKSKETGREGKAGARVKGEARSRRNERRA